MTAPVVLISFNRPDITRRTLERIRAAAPSQLFLIADGPRPGREDDLSSTAAVRAELERIDWPCDVQRRFSERNWGAPASIELGLDWVFGQVDEAIIVEDDCLPTVDFFPFCTELLERYRSSEQVWQVAGRAPLAPPELMAGASYCFTAFGPVWGWATWRRAWRAHRSRFPRMHDGSPAPVRGMIDLASSRLVTRAGRRYFADVGRDHAGRGFSWDSYWALSVVCGRGMSATSTANLIENIGFGAEATNTRNATRELAVEPVTWPLSHPAELAIDTEIERVCERVLTSHHGRAVRFVASRLPDGRIRSLARSAVEAWRNWLVPAR